MPPQVSQNDDPFASFEAESAKLGLMPTEGSNQNIPSQQVNEPDPFAGFEAESAKLGLMPTQPAQTTQEQNNNNGELTYLDSLRDIPKAVEAGTTGAIWDQPKEVANSAMFTADVMGQPNIGADDLGMPYYPSTMNKNTGTYGAPAPVENAFKESSPYLELTAPKMLKESDYKHTKTGEVTKLVTQLGVSGLIGKAMAAKELGGMALSPLATFYKAMGSTEPAVLVGATVFETVRQNSLEDGAGQGKAFFNGLISTVLFDLFHKNIKSLNDIIKDPSKIKAAIAKSIAKSEFKEEANQAAKTFTGEDLPVWATSNNFLVRLVRDHLLHTPSAHDEMKESAIKLKNQIKDEFGKTKTAYIESEIKAPDIAIDTQVDVSALAQKAKEITEKKFIRRESSEENKAFRIAQDFIKGVENKKASEVSGFEQKTASITQAKRDLQKNHEAQKKIIEESMEQKFNQSISEEINTVTDNVFAKEVSPQIASEKSLEAFIPEKTRRKAKKNELYKSIDYGSAKSKPEMLLSSLEETLTEMGSGLGRTSEEKAVVSNIKEVLTDLGVLNQSKGKSGVDDFEQLSASELAKHIQNFMKNGKVKASESGKLRDVTAQELSDRVRSWNNMAWKNNTEPMGVKSLYGKMAKTAESEMERILTESGNSHAIGQRKEANKYFAEEIAGKNRSSVGLGMTKKDIPQNAYSFMSTPDKIRLLKKTLGESKEAKEAFEELKDAKIKEIFLDKIFNPDGTVKPQAYANMMFNKTRTNDILVELMGQNVVNHLKASLKRQEAFYEKELGTQLSALEKNYEQSLKALEGDFNNLLSEIQSNLVNAQKAPYRASLEELGTLRQQIVERLKDPSTQYNSLAKGFYEDLQESSDAVLAQHFKKDKKGLEAFLKKEEQSRLQYNKEQFKEFYKDGIKRERSEEIDYARFPNKEHNSDQWHHLKSITNASTFKKLEELGVWARDTHNVASNLTNPSKSTNLFVALSSLKKAFYIGMGIAEGGLAYVMPEATVATLGATAGGGLAVWLYSKTMNKMAKLICDTKFSNIVSNVKHNPSAENIKKASTYFEDRMGLTIQEFNEMIDGFGEQ